MFKSFKLVEKFLKFYIILLSKYEEIFYHENNKETIMDSRLRGNDRGRSFRFLLP